ncbi:cell division protein ZapA [Rhodoferax sp. WC2427]|uniref:cell division protein ZapA n=1 Tax=Rhodoferax sp. WC2427 TaxID=3234144 RepID=UPI003465E7EF
MKQLDVQILGQSYLLGCPEGGEARLLEAVKMVDTAMCAIRDGGKIKARDRIAVLAALNLAFDLTDRGRAPTRPAPAPTEAASNDDPVLSTLIEQLDLALGDDGKLL